MIVRGRSMGRTGDALMALPGGTTSNGPNITFQWPLIVLNTSVHKLNGKLNGTF